MEDFRHRLPRQPPRPPGQEPRVGVGQLVFAARPRHSLHFHCAARARHSAHRVHQEHRDPPQRHELKPPGRQGVVAGRRFPATRALRPGVRSRSHLHFQSHARALYQPHRSVNERPVPLNPIQDSLDLHPVPFLQVDGSLATPSSQSLERGALSTLSGLSLRAFYPQIPRRSLTSSPDPELSLGHSTSSRSPLSVHWSRCAPSKR